MAFEMVRKQETIDIVKPYRIKSEITTECKIWLQREKIQEGIEF